MVSRSFTEFSVHRINTDTPRILGRIKTITKHVTLLSGIGESKAIEPRDLLRCVNEARGEALQLHHELTRLAELRAGVRRAHLGTSYGAFASGFQGTVKRIGKEFDGLGTAIGQLENVASSRLAEPGRWGDAAASGPVTDLMGLLFQLVEVWGLLRVRNKLEA